MGIVSRQRGGAMVAFSAVRVVKRCFAPHRRRAGGVLDQRVPQPAGTYPRELAQG